MPHIILSYAAPLSAKTDIQKLVEDAFDGAEQSGLFTPAAIKARAISIEHYWTGGTKQLFIHAEIKLLPGRTAEQKKDLAERVFTKLTANVTEDVSISVEINDLDADSYTKRV